eukprot:3105104-Prymnesium_polylepis.1
MYVVHVHRCTCKLACARARIPLAGLRARKLRRLPRVGRAQARCSTAGAARGRERRAVGRGLRVVTEPAAHVPRAGEERKRERERQSGRAGAVIEEESGRAGERER